MRKILTKSSALVMVLLLLTGCIPQESAHAAAFCAGFAREVLVPLPLDSFYIAGYHNGQRPKGMLDDLYVSALWLDNGGTSLLLISVDCVGLSSETAEQIRTALKAFCKETGCASVNIVSTHTHAGVDTLGLWGPIGIDGKQEAFMQQLVEAAAKAAKAAYADRTAGSLYYSKTKTEGLQADSREPTVYDENLYQLRFSADDSSKHGIRILSFAAHAEALRGSNRLISSDYPGIVRKIVEQETGDRVMFLPGAVGGLIMTKELIQDNAVENLRLTGEKIARYALQPHQERLLSPEISIVRQEWETRLENTLFVYYKFLGILGNEIRRGFAGNYLLKTELNLLRIGDIILALLPGEIFPELVFGTGEPGDPEALNTIAQRYGTQELVIVGLANDEIGYIVPPGDFLLDETAPYVQAAPGHYEETNSVGPYCARDLAQAFEEAFARLQTTQSAIFQTENVIAPQN